MEGNTTKETSVDHLESGTLILEIILHKGRNLKKTLTEKIASLMMDNVMDPYVRFEVTRPSHLADTAVQKSSNKDNEENPEWEEQLSFLVDEREPGQLQMTLWDANYVFDSQMSEPVSIELDQLPVGGDYQRRTVKIHTTGEIEISLQMMSFKGDDIDTMLVDTNRVKQSQFDKELYPHSYIQRVDVIIYEGRNLKKSLYQKISQLMTDPLMDPYVEVRVTKPWEKAAAVAVQNTTSKNNTENPEWDEELSFLIDTRGGPGQLQLTIWDSNLLMDSAMTKSIKVELSEIDEGSEYERKKLEVYDGGVLEIYLRRRIPTADIRYGDEVHGKEKEIVAKRREKASSAIMALLEPGIKAQKVPTVGVVASGGGIRAMIGLSGSVRALRDAGLFDCCTYMSTLSGSTWYLSQLYLLKEDPDIDKCSEQLRERCSVMAPLMDASRVPDHFDAVKKKYYDGHDTSLVDIWAAMIGDVFKPVLEKQGRTLLSDAQDRVATCQLPFPIYAAVYVKEEKTTETYAEWVEFTPFEYGVRNFKLFTAIEDISSDRHLGIISRRSKEFNVNFMQGLWGSAFAGSIHVWVKTLLAGQEDSIIGKSIHRILGWTGMDDWRPLAATLPNYMNGISCVPQSRRRILYDVKRTFIDHLPPGNSVQLDYQQSQKTGVSLGSLKEEKSTGKEKVHRAGRVRDTNDTSADGQSKRARFPSSGVLQAESLTVVDAGLDFNLAFPPVLRPERPTDVFLVFDYSWLGTQENDPFKELRKTKQWADENGYKFPTITDDIFDKDQLKEYYIVEDAGDPDCPSVVFFSLCNVSRRDVDIPGQDDSFAKVDPFAPVYSTFNFNYTADDFQRLHELCYYNATLAAEDIKKVIARKLK